MLVERLTGGGAGAIAVLGVRGPGAERALRAAFPRRRFEAGRASAGTIGDADEVVLARTGDESFEVCTHGGAADRVARALGARGAVEAPAPLLARARTWLAFRVLSWKAEGILDETWDAVVDALARPRRVVLAGAPNAGKSSLFNALLERDRALVAPEPGTTRDVIEEAYAVEGVPIVLCDTAGLPSCGGSGTRAGAGGRREAPAASERSSDGALDGEAARRATRAVAGADLVIEVVDGSLARPPRAVLRADGSPAALVVLSKADLGRRAVDLPEAIAVSSVTGEGLEQLAHALATRILGRDPREVRRP